MEELRSILQTHAARYPCMEPADAVKLLYQNTFGGGHLIRDEAACRDYLRQEWAATPKDPACPLWESIGNGIVRVHLAAVADPLWLEEAFLCSARERRGTVAEFQRKLLLLQELSEEGVFSFSPMALRQYLTDYWTMGYPAVSHSPCYRQHYNPSYRVILKQYLPAGEIL